MYVYVDSSCLLFYVHDLNFARRENISPVKAVFFSNVVKTRRLQRHLVRLLERGVNPFISGERKKKSKNEKALQLQGETVSNILFLNCHILVHSSEISGLRST